MTTTRQNCLDGNEQKPRQNDSSNDKTGESRSCLDLLVVASSQSLVISEAIKAAKTHNERYLYLLAHEAREANVGGRLAPTSPALLRAQMPSTYRYALRIELWQFDEQS
uniref:Uncharacterized protein n=1 Tax=Trichogramma kaykai TaxID=54128 RepID=A0ABD2X3M6_9HYME